MLNKGAIYISKEAYQEYMITIDDIKLDMDGRVWLEDELTTLKWNVLNDMIIITKCKKDEE